MLEKRVVTVINPTTKQEELVTKYFDVVVETSEREVSFDAIDSQITQKENLIENTEEEIRLLKIKKEELLSL